MHLENAHRHPRLAKRRVLPRVPREADDGRDALGPIARVPVRHEAAVRVSGEIDARRVDGVARERVAEELVQVRDVVDGQVVEVAARFGGVPEASAGRIRRAVRQSDEEPVLVRERLDAEPPRDLGVVSAEPVEEHEERRARLVARRLVHGVRSGRDRRRRGRWRRGCR